MNEWKNRNAWGWVLVSAVIAWILGHILDLFKSSAITLWGRFLSIISLGSTAVRDAPYAMAALNPYPLPSLVLVTIGVSIPLATSLVVMRRFFWQPKKEAGSTQSPDRSTRGVVRDRLVTSIILVIMPIGMVVPVGILNQAVLVRRVYEADRDIIAPHLTSSQMLQLQADFCAVQTKAQFAAVMKQIRVVAENNKTTLRPENLQ